MGEEEYVRLTHLFKTWKDEERRSAVGNFSFIEGINYGNLVSVNLSTYFTYMFTFEKQLRHCRLVCIVAAGLLRCLQSHLARLLE